MWSSCFIFICAVAVAGIGTHHLLFIHGEWHMQAPKILNIYFGLAVLVTISQVVSNGTRFGLEMSFAIVVTYSFSLFTSIFLYRAAFHRLRGFPGPFWAGISKLWHVAKCVESSSQNHIILDNLHQRYGDFVRTGPSEITVFHPDVFGVTDGPGNSCGKAVWYDFLLPEVAINTTRDKPTHDQRRRIWDHGFSTNALREYQKRIAEFANDLDSNIDNIASAGTDVDITPWLYWYSFDVMGEFAFARTFNMLRDKKWHRVVLMLRSAMSLLGTLSPVPWLAQIGFSLIPNLWVVKDWYLMINWCKRRMIERVEMEPRRIDVSSFLIEASRKRDSLEQDRHLLNGDSIAIIIAGSDTVATTLVYTLYHLAKSPEQADKLFQELSVIDTKDHDALRVLPHLNGIINEILRLHPPVPSGGYRETPIEGVMIGGKHIPGLTTIVAPRYTIGRLETCFEKADQFIPERWYEKTSWVKEKKAFAPFSQGRYSCVGKNLALTELRYVTAMLASKYHMEFPEGYDGREVELLMRDQFTSAPGPLRILFRRRA